MSNFAFIDRRAASTPTEKTSYLAKDRVEWKEGLTWQDLKPEQWFVTPGGSLYKCLADGSIFSGSTASIATVQPKKPRVRKKPAKK